MLKVNTQAVDNERLIALEPELASAHSALYQGTGKGNDFLGWLRLPGNYDKNEFERIQKAAAKIQSDSQVLVVVGIGGSYLGARAVIEFCKGAFYNIRKKDTPDIFFVGNNLSAGYIEEIISLIGERDFSVNVISKSGTTTEPAVAFRIFKDILEQKYGKDGARERIYATTDKEKGALKGLSTAEGYESFVIPDDIGGRYSVLTPVGLLPIAAAGIDISLLMEGASNMAAICSLPNMNNPAWQYAGARNVLYREGKTIEVLACYEPDFMFMAEWWKQLYGESEGKNSKGIFPASVSFTADLHSMGQYLQEGIRNLIETVVVIEKPTGEITVGIDKDNIDGLNFLAGKSIHEIGQQAYRGTYLAHMDGGLPNLLINIDAKDEKSLGELIYFFEISCGLSGYLLGENPFDQPGVEAYKKNMFALLGKPGYEELGKRLNERLQF